MREKRHPDRRKAAEAAAEAADRPFTKPNNEMPGCVPIEAMLASSEDVAIFVCALSVYRHGVDLTVEVRARPGRPVNDQADFLGSAIFGHGSEGQPLRLEVEFADGRRTSDVHVTEPSSGDPRQQQPRLWSSGGGGDDRSASASWFLTPLPPPGDLRIACAWPSRGVPETITTLSAEPILSAAARARELWPWAPRTWRGHPGHI